jgi:undecaprenyl-diphosphatase
MLRGHWRFLLFSVLFAGGITIGLRAEAEVASTPAGGPGPDPAAVPLTEPAEAARLGYFEALVLGVVEGITEYLPISSTGHLILTNQLLGLDDSAPILTAEGELVRDGRGEVYTLKQAADAYIIIIQAGAILAVAVLYWRRLWSVARGLLGRDPRGLRLGLNLLVAFLPAAVLGLLLNDWIEALLFAPLPIALALAGGSVLMWGVERWRGRRPAEALAAAEKLDLPDLSYRQCLAIGFLQCVAMWPGTSRSMMTIVGGYLVGLTPRRAAEFSFLLGFITLSAAAGYKTLKDGRDMLQVFEPGPILFGAFVAFLSAALAVKWLVGYLSRHGLALFVWYRLGLALLVALFMTS